MNARVLGFFLIVLLPLNAGCIIPLAIVPVPSVCSGEEVVFQDENGNPVQADGMLIANRSRYHRFFLAGFYELPSNQITPVRSGRARIPFDMCPMTLGLTGNEILIGYGLAGTPSDPLCAIPYLALLTPLMLVPVPIVTPDDELRLIPLLEGYHPVKGDDFQLYTSTAIVVVAPESRRKPIVVRSNADDPDVARTYLRAVRERLRRRFQKPKCERPPDLRLEYYHYNKVRAFIDAELKRIASLRDSKTADDG